MVFASLISHCGDHRSTVTFCGVRSFVFSGTAAQMWRIPSNPRFLYEGRAISMLRLRILIYKYIDIDIVDILTCCSVAELPHMQLSQNHCFWYMNCLQMMILSPHGLGPRICISGKRMETVISNTWNWFHMMILSLRRPRLEFWIFTTRVLTDFEWWYLQV